MDTNLALRIQALRLVKLGLNQKVIAARMGMKESAFSRWLNLKVERPATVAALDGLRQLLSDLKHEATLDVTTLSKEDIGQMEAHVEASKTMRQIQKKRAALRTGKKHSKIR